MKKFLEDLKIELQKLKFSKKEIEEILADHQEMIETAKNEGLTDEEIVLKFGNPEQLAHDLKENSKEPTFQTNKGGMNVEGYELSNTFPVMDKAFDIKIELVSEDVTYELHDLDQIEVYYKNIKDLEKYEIEFDGKEFVLKRTSSKISVSWSKTSGEFLIKVPIGIENKTFNVVTVSGDADLQGITTGELNIKTTSGDFELNEFKATDAKITTVSGDVELKNGTIGTMTVAMVSGDVECKNTNCEGTVDINTVSGDFEAENCYFGPLNFKTVSGDVEGKEFYPKSINLRSVSGDVEIHNSDKEFKIDIISKKSVSGTVSID